MRTPMLHLAVRVPTPSQRSSRGARIRKKLIGSWETCWYVTRVGVSISAGRRGTVFPVSAWYWCILSVKFVVFPFGLAWKCERIPRLLVTLRYRVLSEHIFERPILGTEGQPDIEFPRSIASPPCILQGPVYVTRNQYASFRINSR
jgi:hypothetical protein